VKRYDDLRVSDVIDPERKDDEVLVNVGAAGLNFVDLLYVRTSSLLQCIKAWLAIANFTLFFYGHPRLPVPLSLLLPITKFSFLVLPSSSHQPIGVLIKP
jgi:hypothetical protein